MFRKLISNLPFSPSLAGQLGFYAKRLSKEEATRRIGLIFTVLALGLQCLTVFQPPEAANASSSSDFVYGGLGVGPNRSIDNFLRPYDKNVGGLKDIMNYAGITRQEISSAQFSSWMTGDTLSWSRTSNFSYAQGERTVAITDNSGHVLQTVYARPMKLANGQARMYGWVGHSSKIGWFAIVQASGDLVTKSIPLPPSPPTTPAAICQSLSIIPLSSTSYRFNAVAATKNGAAIQGYTFDVKNTSGTVVATKVISTTASSATITQDITPGKYTIGVVVKTSLGDEADTNCSQQLNVSPPGACPLNSALTVENADCQPCLSNQTLWVKDEKCAAQIIETKNAFNLDQNTDATQVAANASERIRYTITAKNEGRNAATISLTDFVKDSLEYARLLDTGGGTLDKSSDILSWGNVTLQPGQSADRTFVVQVDDAIPAIAQGVSDPTSYDCIMTNTFGTSTNVKVNCPAPKVIEQAISTLPRTGTSENFLFIGLVFTVVTYFYARARQMKKEVRLIRRDLNAGVI